MDNFQQNFDQNLSTGSSGSFASSAYQYGAPRSRVTTVIAITALILSLGATGGIWWWHHSAMQLLQDQQTALTGASSKYKKADIDELVRQRDDLARAKELISKHPIPSTLVDWLADNTEASVFWSDFAYRKGAAGEKSPVDSLSLTGSAQGYTGLIVQMRHFRGQGSDSSRLNNAIRAVELGSYTLDDKTSRINFTVKISLDPDFVSLPRVIARGGGGVVSNPQPTSVPVPVVPTPATSTPTAITVPLPNPSSATSTPTKTATTSAGMQSTSTKSR
jgi:hypothetical protein